MGVFSNWAKKPKEESNKPFSYTQHEEPMRQDRLTCLNGHTINGEYPPPVNAEILHVQNTELIGKPCDCGNVTYSEENCGCSIPRWEIKWKEQTFDYAAYEQEQKSRQ